MFSGWGGIGGAIGQWGLARSMLLNLPAVQEELKLTDEQKQKLREWAEVMRGRGEEMTRGMREEAEESVRAGRFQFNMLEMMNTMQMLLKENENGFAKVLTAEQRKRLDQIALQMEGVTALARPDVAQAVRLQPNQVEQIQQIIAQARTRQVFYWMDQGRRMWSERNRQRGQQGPTEGGVEADGSFPRTGRPIPPSSGQSSGRRPSQEPAPAAKKSEGGTPSEAKSEREVKSDDADEPEDEEVAAARAEERRKREKEMRERFEGMRSGADAIQEETVGQILKILTRRQRASYEKLLGPPFDPESVTRGLDPRQRPGGPVADKNGEPKP